MFTKSLVLFLPLLFLVATIVVCGKIPSLRDNMGDMLTNFMGKTGMILYVQMNTSQGRVIDPILSTVAQGFKQQGLIGASLFPNVPVDQRGGKIITFGKEDFQIANSARAPGANTKRVTFGYSGSNYALEQHSLEGLVPFEIMEDASQVPGVDMGKVAVMKTQRMIALRLEKLQADLATNAANYAASNKLTLSGTSQWSDLVNSQPATNIADAIEVVRSKIGMRPNTVVLGAAVYAKLKNHKEVTDRIKYTGRDVVTPELLAGLWDVQRVLIGDAVMADDAGTFSDVWGKSVVIAYTEVSGIEDMGSPSYGYTYRLRGNPHVEVPYSERNQKSWVYPVTDEFSPVIAGALAGFLYSAVVA